MHFRRHDDVTDREFCWHKRSFPSTLTGPIDLALLYFIPHSRFVIIHCRNIHARISSYLLGIVFENISRLVHTQLSVKLLYTRSTHFQPFCVLVFREFFFIKSTLIRMVVPWLNSSDFTLDVLSLPLQTCSVGRNLSVHFRRGQLEAYGVTSPGAIFMHPTIWVT